jgi:hypothetical protein
MITGFTLYRYVGYSTQFKSADRRTEQVLRDTGGEMDCQHHTGQKDTNNNIIHGIA